MSTDLVVQTTDLAPSTLFGTDNPGEVVERAAKVAKTLADLVRKQNLIVRIQQSDHVRVEGWTLLGSMLGVFPVVVWTKQVLRDEQPFGWEARVEARTRNGEVVGAAEAECLRDEKPWSFAPTNRYGKALEPRDDYALRSMAQTRAVSKALRLPLGFVMQLAGFDPTPADEMPVIDAPYVDPAAGTPFAYNDEDVVLGLPGSVGAATVEDVAAASPGSQAAVTAPELAAPTDSPTAPMLKKLNVLVGKLRPDHISTLQLWQSMGREPVPSEDGVLHWSPLRDSLSKSEAHTLIDRLDTYAKVKLGAAA